MNDNLNKTAQRLGNAVIQFANLPIERAYVSKSNMKTLANNKLVIPSNIDYMLSGFGNINKNGGKEISYYLIGIDSKAYGNPNCVSICSMIYSNNSSATNQSCSMDELMTSVLNNELSKIKDSDKQDIVVFQGHTHPNTQFSNFFSLQDLANIREHSTDTNFQLGAFLVCPQNQDGTGNLTYRATFYDRQQDDFYNFTNFQLGQNQGVLIEAESYFAQSQN